MSGTCSICLHGLTEPVCVPCGHIYCAECIADYVNLEEDGFAAKCPTCRSLFTIVNPDLAFLPKKYHQFVLPSIRRVYLDSSDMQAMQRKLKDWEKKARALEKSREQLMRECERHMASSRAHAQGEAAAAQALADAKLKFRVKMDKARRENEELSRTCAMLQKKYERAKKELKGGRLDDQQEHSEPSIAFSTSSETPFLPSSTLKRKSFAGDTSNTIRRSSLSNLSGSSSSRRGIHLDDEGQPPAKRARGSLPQSSTSGLASSVPSGAQRCSFGRSAVFSPRPIKSVAENIINESDCDEEDIEAPPFW